METPYTRQVWLLWDCGCRLGRRGHDDWCTHDRNHGGNKPPSLNTILAATDFWLGQGSGSNILEVLVNPIWEILYLFGDTSLLNLLTHDSAVVIDHHVWALITYFGTPKSTGSSGWWHRPWRMVKSPCLTYSIYNITLFKYDPVGCINPQSYLH